MTDDILDIAKWEQKYPFLDKVLDKYKEFSKPMQEEDTNKNYYYFVCHKIITDLHGDIQKNITYCMKLIRNLGHYSYNTDYFDPTFERCNILYNWLYHSSKSEKIPDTIIEKCFDDYNFQIRGITSNYKCSYDLYKNMYLEPIKINILNLFDNNIQIIRQILIGRDDSKKTLCRKFVCECVNIYKHMSNTYCPNGKAKQKDYSNTCSKLYDFKQSYTLLHSNGGLSNLNIPSLDYIDRDFITKCPADEQKKVLRLHEVSTLQPAIGNRLKADAGDPTNSLEGVTTSATEDNSMKKHITTTIGTVAGASSLLAFLYKFTSPGRLFSAPLRRSGGRINENLYANEESEFILDGFSHRNINSYNIGYEAA